MRMTLIEYLFAFSGVLPDGNFGIFTRKYNTILIAPNPTGQLARLEKLS